MTRAILLAAAGCAALGLAACNNNKGPADAATDANAAASAVNSAQDATSAAVGAAASATAAATDATGLFVAGLATGNMYEIEAAKIAQTKAKDPAVKAFARMMATDHGAMGKEAEPALKASGKDVPIELDQRRKGLIDNLNAATAETFDKTYIDQQVAAHDETLTLVKGYADGGDNTELKAIATKAAPKVQAHLDKAKELQAKLP